MTNLRETVVKAVENSNKWMNGSMVIKDGDSFEAIPYLYLNDISYTGSKEVVIVIEPGSWDAELWTIEEYAEWLIQDS